MWFSAVPRVATGEAPYSLSALYSCLPQMGWMAFLIFCTILQQPFSYAQLQDCHQCFQTLFLFNIVENTQYKHAKHVLVSLFLLLHYLSLLLNRSVTQNYFIKAGIPSRPPSSSITSPSTRRPTSVIVLPLPSTSCSLKKQIIFWKTCLFSMQN